jgi:hypothetical protein
MAKAESPSREPARERARLNKLLFADYERAWAKRRSETLTALANLSDTECDWFWRRFRLAYRPREGDSVLLRFREQLRKIWSGDADATRDAMYFWVNQVRLNNRKSWLLRSDGASYWVIPNYSILPLSLAVGVSELRANMAVCANPDCPQPYFFKGRITQRYCERPACVVYAQRQHKRKWWKDNRGKSGKRKPKT